MRIVYQLFVTAVLVSVIQSKEWETADLNGWYKLFSIHSKVNYNLTQDVLPISYNVKLNTDFENGNVTLDGNAQININVIKSTDVITLRARNMIIKPDAHLKCDHSTIEPVISTIEPIDNVTELFKIILSNKLDVGSNCNLTFNYTRENVTSSTYMTQFTGQLLDTTHMLASYNLACDILPCPPDRTLKVSFTISIEHSKNYIALSHMEAMKVEKNSENPERVITHFAESPKMHPTKFAFLVGNFIQDNHNKNFQAFTTTTSFLNQSYVQETGINIMNALSNYTGVPYETFGLKKLKIIMGDLPIVVGGIALYGITLINTPNHVKIFANSTLDSNTVSKIELMAHEMSHQWFFSIVYRTVVEADWFLEGIPEYLSYVAVNQVQPTWRMMDQFVIYNLQYGAFESDQSIHSTHMANKDANTVKKLEIIYYKSSCIIRMISHVLGEANFKIALKNFIRSEDSGVITNAELIKELSKVYTGNINLTDAFYNWINLPGYAVINVKRDYDTGKAIITQSRFLKEMNQTSSEKYWIPINFVTEDNLNFMDTNVTHWLDPSKDSIEIDQLKKDQFVIFNKQQFGYYRVNYDIQNWNLIINYLNSKNYSRIHVLNRAQLIHDAFNLAIVGQLDYKVVLSLLTYLKQETDPIPWAVAFEAMKKIYMVVKYTDMNKYFKKYITELSENLQQEMVSDPSNETVLIMDGTKQKISKWARNLISYSESTITHQQQLINWLNDPEKNALPTENRCTILCKALNYAGQELWDRVWDQYRITNDSDLEYSLKCTKNVTIMKQYLGKLIPDNASTDQITSVFEKVVVYRDDTALLAIIDYIFEYHNKTTIVSDEFIHFLENIWKLINREIFDEPYMNKLKTLINANKVSMEQADKMIADIENKLKYYGKQLYEMKEFFEKYRTIESNNSNSRPSEVDIKNNSN
ncbi:hypothetical protein PV327_000817 [Microctonus hyperodae]|uniref:Aminopeptidase n=1 Tax=Microctonus hyperodae TaxID=165561 RepID=A0AA39G709_MICHY|nr:hypothetical protein PV327_000817 [Microctonus hyperodae]